MMNERIKKLRKALGLTQQEFADKIKVKRNTVATYEMGRSVPSDAAISLICNTFSVSEAWLRDGVGEMELAKPSAALDALAMERDLSSADYVFIEKYLNMKKADRKVIVDFMLEISAAVSQMEPDAVWEASTPEFLSARPLTPEEIDRRTAEYHSGLEMDYDIQRRRSSPAPAARPEDDPEIKAQMEEYGQRLLSEKKQASRTSVVNE